MVLTEESQMTVHDSLMSVTDLPMNDSGDGSSDRKFGILRRRLFRRWSDSKMMTLAMTAPVMMTRETVETLDTMILERL